MLICDACAGRQWRAGGQRTATSKIALRCARCGSVVFVDGASVEVGGAVLSADATPRDLVPIGGDASDPWVWMRLRMLVSQREVVQRAIATVVEAAGLARGPGSPGQALELICADYLAGAPMPHADGAELT